jgi:hypothetical protein
VKKGADIDGRRPNGLPFSCRKRWNNLQKANDLVREAVGWNGVFGGVVVRYSLLMVISGV